MVTDFPEGLSVEHLSEDALLNPKEIWPLGKIPLFWDHSVGVPSTIDSLQNFDWTTKNHHYTTSARAKRGMTT